MSDLCHCPYLRHDIRAKLPAIKQSRFLQSRENILLDLYEELLTRRDTNLVSISIWSDACHWAGST